MEQPNVRTIDIAKNLFNDVNKNAATGIWIYSTEYFSKSVLQCRLDTLNVLSLDLRMECIGICSSEVQEWPIVHTEMNLT